MRFVRFNSNKQTDKQMQQKNEKTFMFCFGILAFSTSKKAK
tara:strand:- start:277 stop:399 length:123 start_codon:yes stop_codon:yes gene_type:complete